MGCSRSKVVNGVCCTIYSLIILFIISIFILFIIYPEKEFEFTVTDATLAEFDFNTTDSTLNYDLAFNIMIRNSNKRLGVRYKQIEVLGIYGKKRFSMVSLPPFYQGYGNTSFLRPVLKGQQVYVPFGRKELPKYAKEKGVGVYEIRVSLAFKIKPKYSEFKFKSSASSTPPQVECDLNVPLTGYSSNRTVAGGFTATECGNVYFFSSPNQGGNF